MTDQLPSKKVIQKRLSDLTIQVFEELGKTKASDKIKKTLQKNSKKVGRTVHSLLRDDIRLKAKTAKKKKKAVAKQNKKLKSKRAKKIVVS